ncbi:MAG: dockerin type I repeat-containing protein [Clostridia bacterium]
MHKKKLPGHIEKLNTGVWIRRDVINLFCNSNEFVNSVLPNYINKIKREQQNAEGIPGLASVDKLKTVGDLNANGKIDADDARICLTIIAKIGAGAYKVDDTVKKYADMDGDGRITPYDACLILQKYARRMAGYTD